MVKTDVAPRSSNQYRATNSMNLRYRQYWKLVIVRKLRTRHFPPRLCYVWQMKGSIWYRNPPSTEILKAEDTDTYQCRAHPPCKWKQPTTHTATQANRLWSLVITYLPSPVSGQYYYLYPYLVEDIYCWRQPLVMHSDNGAPMKSSTTQAKLYDLGFTPARCRPRVCNENPYSESLFRTVQYFPQWPKKGIENLEDACIWVHDFIVWYNQSIVTAALVTSHQISIAGVRIKLYWRNVMPSAKRQGEEIRNTGQDAHVIGHPPKIISPFVKWQKRHKHSS